MQTAEDKKYVVDVKKTMERNLPINFFNEIIEIIVKIHNLGHPNPCPISNNLNNRV